METFVFAAAAEIDGLAAARIASRALHILAAIILGGGLFYLRSVLAPAGVDACFADRRAIWAKWVGIASFLLIASGLLNFFTINADVKAAGEKLPPAYHALFGVKVLLALLVMFIASILAGKTDAAERFRAGMRRWLGVAWLSVIAIVVIGATLRMLHGRTPADDAPETPAAVEVESGQES
jgi:hypothetical protein